MSEKSLEHRIQTFVTLGNFLKQFSKFPFKRAKNQPLNDLFFEPFALQIKKSTEANAWFSTENICRTMLYWGKQLNEKTLKKWLSNYTIPKRNAPKNIAVIMAGNIPLVGFHDFLCVLLCGEKIQIKPSSNDKYLLPFIAKYISHLHSDFKNNICFSPDKLEPFDAVIATGSNNTSHYFESYFGKYPHIIRKHKNSVAILTGKETLQDLQALAEDIFAFFGLGCRSISKIFVPKNYDFTQFFESLEPYKYLLSHQKYKNNYDYNKAVYLMSLFEFKDNGFFILKEDKNYGSPIASLFFECYEHTEALEKKLKNDAEKIQCITSALQWKNTIPFGQAQKPKLWEYADGKDTLDFIINL